jgi:hypothetical protein
MGMTGGERDGRSEHGSGTVRLDGARFCRPRQRPRASGFAARFCFASLWHGASAPLAGVVDNYRALIPTAHVNNTALKFTSGRCRLYLYKATRSFLSTRHPPNLSFLYTFHGIRPFQQPPRDQQVVASPAAGGPGRRRRRLAERILRDRVFPCQRLRRAAGHRRQCGPVLRLQLRRALLRRGGAGARRRRPAPARADILRAPRGDARPAAFDI